MESIGEEDRAMYAPIHTQLICAFFQKKICFLPALVGVATFNSER